MATVKNAKVDESISTACDNLKEAGSNFKEAAVSAKEGASELASENYQKGVDNAKKASSYVGEIVKEKPVAAIATAFAAGWLISKLLK